MDWVFYSRNNQEMVDKFTRLGIIESSEVERAFRCVSRAAFVPDDLLEDAFKDTPLRGSQHVHLSAPHMYAAILEELELDVGMSFLNVGSGTGYFSTLAGYIIKKDGINHGIELHEDLVKFANDRIAAFIGNGPPDSKDICTPVLIAGNASRLDPDQMKYDRLYCGAACSQANVKFLLKMVKVGGFLIAPVGSRLIKLNRVSLKEGRQSVINDVSFAPLVEATAEEMKLPRLRFPDHYNKKSRKNSVSFDVSFHVSKSPGRKLLAKMRAYQDAVECLQRGLPLPMPYCYVPCYEDLCKAKTKDKKSNDNLTESASEDASSSAVEAAQNTSKHDLENDLEHAAVDTQIDFFNKPSTSSSSSDFSKEMPLAESTVQMDSHSPVKKTVADVDWEFLSTNRTWLEVLEHYYSLCATTEARRNECTNIKVENPDSFSDQLKILTFKKYAKQMGLLPSKSRKKSGKGDTKTDSKGDAPVVEDVANDIVENLLEEVISQVDENDLAENFLAAVTGTGPFSNSDIRRRSSVARAIILDNLPRLRACAEEAGTLSPTLQTLIRTIDDDDDRSREPYEESQQDSQTSHVEETAPREASLLNMQTFINNVIADIDEQILHNIASDASQGYIVEEESVPEQNEPISNDLDVFHESTETDSFDTSAATHTDLAAYHASDLTDKITEDRQIACSRKLGSNERVDLKNVSLVKESENQANFEVNKNPGNFVVDLRPDQIYVKKDAYGYFKPPEDTTEEQVWPSTCDKSDLSSFALHSSLPTPGSSHLILLEQKSALRKEGGLNGIRSEDTGENPETYLRRPGRLFENVRTKSAVGENWDGGLACVGSSFLRDEEEAPGRSSIPCAEKESGSSFLRNLCSGKSTESTPNLPNEFIGKPHNFDLREGNLTQDSVFDEELSFDGMDPLHGMDFKYCPVPDVCDTSSGNKNKFGASLFHLSPCSSTNSSICPIPCEPDQLTGHMPLDEKCPCSATCATPDVIGSIADAAVDNTAKCDDIIGQRSSDLFLDMSINSSLLASSPVASTAHSAICKDKEDISNKLNTDALAVEKDVSKEILHMKSQLPYEKSCISRNYKPRFMTHYTSSFKKKRMLRKAFMSIKMDVPSSKMLRNLPGRDWSMRHDKELVLYLSRKEKMSGHVAFSNCCANVITPKCFSSSDLLQYKLICSFPADALTRRGIVLKRLAEVLDSVMNMLVGPSLMRDQLKTPCDRDCSLPSFTNASFESSGIPLNVDPHLPTTDRNEEPPSCKSTQKLTSQTKSLMEFIDAMMNKEIDNVRRQKTIARAKLDLYNNLSVEYDEQMRLIKEQVGLVEEQQQLLQSRLRGRFQCEDWRQTLQQTEQMIQERKLHKRQILEQLSAIKEQVEQKVAERESVVRIYKQLSKLEKRLVDERTKSTTMLWRNVEDEDKIIDSLTQSARRCDEISNRLTGLGAVLDIHSTAENTVISDNEEEENSVEIAKETVRRSKYRYHPHLLLAKSRFLFPLTSKRLGIIKELLRVSETGPLHPCNVARIDRRVPLKERYKYPASNTVFMQIYNALKSKELDFREAKRHFEKLWEVKFIGEGIIDQGGGFRDSLAEMADELCPASAEIKECLTFFIKTPNQKSGIGDYRDAYIPNPSCTDYHIYTWIGKLIGSSFRTDETLPLCFPPFVWKLLIGDNVTWSGDYIGVDETVVRVTDGTALLAEDTYNEMYGLDQTYIVNLSDGTEQELIPEGCQISVRPSDREEYAKLVRKARMLESEKQVKAMRDGLISVVPEALLSCLTWQDFERSVCGSPEITVNDLKANCRYEYDLSPTVDSVSFLWEALASFTSEERSKFVRFVTGRRRLPSPFYISRCSNNDQHLPSASTCGCNLFLPNYTDAQVAAEKIRYAINNCVSIDTDTYPW